jgi:hypothetical protein
MLAGLDSSAPHAPPAYFDEAYFLQNINPEGEKLFDYIDGWTSHSYPNPGFAGSPYNAGRGSIRSYEWELATLEGLGVSKNLPVFITETGWTSTAFSYDTIGEFFKIAYESVWLPDARVRAVTPFILNYQGEPFLQFSWKKFLNPSDPNPVLGLEEKAYYEHYYAVQSLKKPVGEPEVLQKGSVALDLPALIVSSSSYSFHVHLKNEGQAIWSLSEGYELKFTDGGKEYLFGALPDVKPHEEVEVPLFFKTNEKEGMATSSVALYRGDKKILESAVWKYEVVAPPSLTFDVRLFPRLRPDPSRRYEIQIFDDHNQIVFKKSGLRAPAGRATIDKVPNVYLGKRFRIVILTRNYLPSQLFVSLKRGDNEVKFARLLPLDFDADGNFDIADVGTLITHPQQFGLLLP